ncbi:tetratricopeptide repeat protein [Chitinimonas lacunae]|uniref:Tetratricopeptide repeat protein n=1 Tax=Chitinimonas lacunae TaxID=1963018 RepID=A0ABV8MWS0_9NEIS
MSHSAAQMTVAQALQIALQSHQQGRWQEAANLYQRVLDADPNNVNALHLLGLLIYQAERNYPLAEQFIRRALALHPTWPEALNNLGSVLRDSGRLVEALEYFQQARTLKPDYAEAAFNTGLCQQQLGQHREAVESLRQALALQPNRLQLRLLLCQSNRMLGRHGDVRAHAKTIPPTAAEYPQAQVELGLSLLVENGPTAARDHFARLIERFPKFGPARLQYAYVRTLCGETSQGIAELETLVAEDPSLIDGWLQLGNSRLASGQAEAAVAAFDRALALAPNLIEAALPRTQALLNLGRKEEALLQLQRYFGAKPDDTGALRAAIDLLTERRAWNEAADYCRRLHELEPSGVNIRISLAKLLNEAHRYQESIAVLRALLTELPEQVEALNLLAVALGETDQIDEAITLCQRAIEIEPSDGAAYSNLGNLYRRIDRQSEAEASYRRGLELNPAWPEGLNNLANSLKDQGRYREALATYRQALELSPDFAGCWSNLGNLYSKLGRHHEALEAFESGVAASPLLAETHVNAALVQLSLGHFEAGWRNFEWRFRGRERRDYPMPPCPARPEVRLPSELMPIDWRDRRVVLLKDQGLGDELFFLRFAQVARARGAYLMYVPDERVQPLIEHLPLIERFCRDGEDVDRVDYVFAIADLPMLLEADQVEDIPPSLPLQIKPAAAEAVAARFSELGLGQRPLLGVTWRGGSEVKRNGALSKQIDAGRIAALLRDLPVDIAILQRNPSAAELASFEAELGRPVFDLSALNADLEQMLALLARLDDYVGVSNTNMHLALGIGKTARVLVPNPADYRWMAEGDSSPWFPGFSVYREQPPEEDRPDADPWQTALERLRSDLTAAFLR